MNSPTLPLTLHFEQQADSPADMTLMMVNDVPASVWSLLLQRIEQRRALRELDERLLADVGLTPEQAMKEANRPFWRS